MVFKVSFKDNPKDPSKVVVRMGNKVGVMVKGTVVLPEFFKNVPDEIITWMTEEQKLISGEEDIATNTFHLKANGHAICHEEDKFDYVFGERLAEARAKCKIYKFFYDLTYRFYNYYMKIMFGTECVVATGGGSCLEGDIYKYEKLYRRELEHQRELIMSRKDG